jgi:ubiquinone/menaquinone biosynthesis C-methylase UbiE
MTIMKSLSFDKMVEFYDETRILDEECFESALDYVVERFPPRAFSSVFEPGIGTGRIAIPLAKRGYRITGVDISEEMLAFLKNRLVSSGKSSRVFYQRGDVTRLPFPDETFDMAIATHLFYFIRDWRGAADEILRVVRKGNPIVLMHTGMGTEIPFLNERYKELCAQYGHPLETIGIKSTGEAVDYYRDLGYHAERISDRWRWVSNIKLDRALGYISSRAYSFTTLAPDSIHSKVVEKLRCELESQFGSLREAVEVPNQIYLVVILKGKV